MERIRILFEGNLFEYLNIWIFVLITPQDSSLMGSTYLRFEVAGSRPVLQMSDVLDYVGPQENLLTAHCYKVLNLLYFLDLWECGLGLPFSRYYCILWPQPPSVNCCTWTLGFKYRKKYFNIFWIKKSFLSEVFGIWKPLLVFIGNRSKIKIKF